MAKRQSKRKVKNSKIVLTKKQLVQLETLSGIGLTIQEIADYLGMSKATLDRRVSEYPEVAESLRVGRSRAQSNVYKAAYDMATDKKHADFTKFYLRSRYNWNEKQEVELSGQVVTMTPEQKFLETLKGMSKDELKDFVAQGRKRTE